MMEDLAIKNQLVYTTHSPFMINREHPERVRLVSKVKSGTQWIAKPTARIEAAAQLHRAGGWRFVLFQRARREVGTAVQKFSFMRRAAKESANEK
jgi:hypothetical protein